MQNEVGEGVGVAGRTAVFVRLRLQDLDRQDRDAPILVRPSEIDGNDVAFFIPMTVPVTLGYCKMVGQMLTLPPH